MTVSMFLDEFTRTRDVKIRLKKNGQLNFRGKTMTYADKILFGMHRKEVVEFLKTGKDFPLTPALKREDYERAGLVQLVEGGPFTHPKGDEEAARILTGMISFEEAQSNNQARTRQGQALKRARKV